MDRQGKVPQADTPSKPPAKHTLPTRFVRAFRDLLTEALNQVDEHSAKKLGTCIGVYIFYDFDGEPIYVGQTLEDFATRIGRHLRGQRTDTVAYRILDPFEVAEMELFPVEAFRHLPDKRSRIDALEYSVYQHAISTSKYHAILNEKIPLATERVELPPSYRFNLIPESMREDREHPDVRIARRAQTLARVAAVAHERGEVSNGLRRVMVVQAVRLADLAAARLAYVQGRPRPQANVIDMGALIGTFDKDDTEDHL